MKELYISPELEILCFAPIENIATLAGSDWTNLGTNSNFQTSDSDSILDDDYTEGVTPEEGL